MPRGTALIMQLCFDSLLIVLQQSCHDCLEQNTAYVTWSLCASVLLLLNVVPIQGSINPVQLSIFRVDCLDFVFYNRKISAYAWSISCPSYFLLLDASSSDLFCVFTWF